ncbi:carbon storage regulator CsrA [Thermospira aquatica]|uniref:Translational regulator CsrA n=1 Tax=Thermospira aquatica TaxID=2828656 RepID=A0AAX3BA76_9SPIR|nr:carbon storage regulator CsrA [Thermospira aquatica]URA09124.1 carbon storage regulator CsrA [Thermospira aquatica]
MLVLSRREEESIIIDDTIEIKIVGIRQDQVKIGIIAPKNVKIFRKEVYQEIQEANKASAVSSLPFDDLKNVLKKDKKTEGGQS